MTKTSFPADFLWGVATSSYQIEGAWDADGKGESIWDRFCRKPGAIIDGSSGDVACDHYHRWQEDITLLKTIGVKAYRFSVAWPRILPDGRGRVNRAGLDFYSRLVDGLLAANIIPFVTLYHWELPQVLEDAGGWPARFVVDAFVEFTDVVTRALGDRVKHWATLNEPFVSAYLGYLLGQHAPGRTSLADMVAASHHLLLAHGRAVPVIRANVADAEAGIVLNLSRSEPASRSIADRAAAYRSDGIVNRWYLDPIAGRGYPADILDHFRQEGASLDVIRDDDLVEIAVPLDFVGVNYYTRHVERSDIPEEQNLPQEVFPGPEKTELGWEVYPEGLYDILGRLYFDYRFPVLYVAENGAAYADEIDANGEVNDPKRIDYLKRHLIQAARAIAAGIPLRGYFAWSLMDNFEWASGYTKRFGLIYVDYAAQQRRILKASAHWYSRVIAANEVVD